MKLVPPTQKLYDTDTKEEQDLHFYKLQGFLKTVTSGNIKNKKRDFESQSYKTKKICIKQGSQYSIAYKPNQMLPCFLTFTTFLFSPPLRNRPTFSPELEVIGETRLELSINLLS